MKTFRVLIAGTIFFVTHLYSQIITAMQVPGDVSKVRLESKAWLSSDFYPITFYMQNNLPIDKNRGDDLINGKVKALHNGKHIAFLIEYSSGDRFVQRELTPSFTHAFAFQFPKSMTKNSRLPYIYMGDPKHPVIVHFIGQNREVSDMNGTNGEGIVNFVSEPIFYERNFISSGFGVLSEIATDLFMDAIYSNGRWRILLVRPLEDENMSLSTGVFPVSLSIWENIGELRRETRYSSAWIGVRLMGQGGGDELVAKLQEKAKGDPQRGKALAIEHCASCHQFPGVEFAHPAKAPRLHRVGAMNTLEYINSSILNPEEVVVPNLNQNAVFPWFKRNESGEKISEMPSFNRLTKEDKEDIATYLQGLY